MISLSSVTNRKFTLMCKDVAEKNNSPVQTVVEMTGTGTNADVCTRTGHGIATAVVSVPLKYMHSSVGCASLDDVVSASRLLAEASAEFDRNNIGVPVYLKGGAELGL